MSDNTDVQLILQDIDAIIEFSKGDVTKDTVAALVPKLKTWNLLHGIYVLRKIMSIQGMEVPHNFAVAVICHDIAKYKNNPDAVKAVFDRFLGEGTYANVFFDHGYASGYLMMHFLKPDPDEISFLFFHTKKYPWALDPEKIPPRDLAFYLIDDLVKGVKQQYRFSMNKNDYQFLSEFLNHPKQQDLKTAFRILKQYKEKKKE